MNVLMNPSIIPNPTNLIAKSDMGVEFYWDWRVGSGTPAALGLDGNYGLKLARFPAAWNFNEFISNREGVTKIKVGVLDEGFSRHEDLDFEVPPTPFGRRNSDHGNLVAGIIAAKFNNGVGIDGGSPFASVLVRLLTVLTPFNQKEQSLLLSEMIASSVELINHRKRY